MYNMSVMTVYNVSMMTVYNVSVVLFKIGVKSVLRGGAG